MAAVLLAGLLLCTSWFRITDAVVPDGCDGRMDLVFVMDHSESIRDNDLPNQPLYNWYHYTNFTKRLVQNLPVQSGDTRVGLVKFGTKATTEFHMDKYRNTNDVQEAIGRMTYDGGKTNTYDALRMTSNEHFFPHPADRRHIRNVMVLMTDGMANINEFLTLTAANHAKLKNIEIFTIGITNEVDSGELQAIATDSKHYIHVSRFDKLEDYIRLVTHRVCGLPDPIPDRPDNGTCEMRMDLCFLIDVSGSITDKNPDDMSYDNFQLLQQFVNDMIDLLDVSPDSTRIGAVKFSDDASLLFNLNTFTNKEDMKHVILYMEYDGGRTNTSGALRVMRNDIFRRERGDRADARNVAILITDGHANNDANLTIPEADLAKEAGVAIFVVGVTHDIKESELKAVASDPDSEYYFNTTNIRNLYKVKDQLIKHVCTPDSPIRKARSVRSVPHQVIKKKKVPTATLR